MSVNLYSYQDSIYHPTYHIFKSSSSKVLQTKLVAQSHEERTKLEVSVNQIVVL